MFCKNFLIGVALSASVFSSASVYASSNCGHDYCANAQSPVVGGFVAKRAAIEIQCTVKLYYQTPAWKYGGKQDFSGSQCLSLPRAGRHGDTIDKKSMHLEFKNRDVAYNFGAVSGGKCPANTGRIAFPDGYIANNGKPYYKSGYTTYVCAKSDTFGN